MKIAITGATGLVGSALIPVLQQAGHEVIPISRSPGDNRVVWDPDSGQLDAAALSGIDAAVHLAGEPLLGRWSSEKKTAIKESREKGTRLLAETLAKLEPRPRVLVSASGMSFYGIKRSHPVDESDEASLDGFLPEVTQLWEAATAPAREAGIRVVCVRISVVLSPEGGMLKMLLPQFKAGLGGPVGSGKMRISWISRHDLARVFRFAIENEEISGPLNAAAPEVLTNKEFAETLGHVLHRPAVMPAPALAVKAAFGQMARETVFADLAMKPAKLHAAGFAFDHPDAMTALQAELQEAEEG
ncbi:MAG: TIGR01777 family oxidoreductase [Opitutales bacterium]